MLLRTRILIADDQPIMRMALRKLLDSDGALVVVGEAPDGEAAIDMDDILRPDVVLMDYDMPHKNGAEAIRGILAHRPRVCIIGLSMSESCEVRREMLDAGAWAFVSKDATDEVLLSVIHQLTDG